MILALIPTAATLGSMLTALASARNRPAGAARGLALLVGGARTALGVVALAVPGLVARPWIGESSRGPRAAVLGRALGGRDLALGVGTLLAHGEPAQLQRWAAAGALADAADVAATLVSFRTLPPRGRLAVLASAGGACLAGAAAAVLLERRG